MKLDPEKVARIWKVVKQIIEIILAALGGLAAGVSANAAGLTSLLSQVREPGTAER